MRKIAVTGTLSPVLQRVQRHPRTPLTLLCSNETGAKMCIDPFRLAQLVTFIRRTRFQTFSRPLSPPTPTVSPLFEGRTQRDHRVNRSSGGLFAGTSRLTDSAFHAARITIRMNSSNGHHQRRRHAMLVVPALLVCTVDHDGEFDGPLVTVEFRPKFVVNLTAPSF